MLSSKWWKVLFRDAFESAKQPSYLVKRRIAEETYFDRRHLTLQRAVCLLVPWLAISGCVAEEAASLDGAWQLDAIDSKPIEVTSENARPFFTISGKKIEGFDGCNQFFGTFDKPGAISTTRRACTDVAYLLPLDLNELGKHLQDATVKDDVLSVPAFKDYLSSSYVRRISG